MGTTKLTSRQARFVDEFLVDANATGAAKRAGYGHSGARVTGHRLLAKANVYEAVEARRQADATRLSITRENVLQRLLEAFEMAREKQEPAAMVSAARELGRLQGYYAPVNARISIDVAGEIEAGRVGELSDAALLNFIRQETPEPAAAT